jgi:hypothetical protein
MSHKPEITPVRFDPKLAVLPVHDMSWENFESLLRSLAKDERGLTHVRVYGERGQSQHGIDIVGMKPNGDYEVIQCKKLKVFAKHNLTSAVQTFLSQHENLPFTASTFAVAVACDVQKTEIVDELYRLNNDSSDVQIELWDRRDICDMLRRHQHIVSTFFGDTAADHFCPLAPPPAVRAKAVLNSTVPIVGRDDDLQRMAAALSNERTARQPKCLILTGMGGIGKTSLASTYVQRNADSYDLFALIRGNHAAVAEGDYRELFSTLSLSA